MGASVEDQPNANKRIPELLKVPAALHFLSVEPLLGPVNVEPWLRDGIPTADQLDPVKTDKAAHYIRHGAPRLGWIIAGSESGPGARPWKEEWFRAIKDQCEAAGVPYFLKQFADHRGRKIDTPELDGQRWLQFPEVRG